MQAYTCHTSTHPSTGIVTVGRSRSGEKLQTFLMEYNQPKNMRVEKRMKKKKTANFFHFHCEAMVVRYRHKAYNGENKTFIK